MGEYYKFMKTFVSIYFIQVLNLNRFFDIQKNTKVLLNIDILYDYIRLVLII